MIPFFLFRSDPGLEKHPQSEQKNQKWSSECRHVQWHPGKMANNVAPKVHSSIPSVFAWHPKNRRDHIQTKSHPTKHIHLLWCLGKKKSTTYAEQHQLFFFKNDSKVLGWNEIPAVLCVATPCRGCLAKFWSFLKKLVVISYDWVRSHKRSPTFS